MTRGIKAWFPICTLGKLTHLFYPEFTIDLTINPSPNVDMFKYFPHILLNHKLARTAILC